MKIILVKNNYKKKVKLDKGLKHLIDNTLLEYQIEEREANFPMQSVMLVMVHFLVLLQIIIMMSFAK